MSEVIEATENPWASVIIIEKVSLGFTSDGNYTYLKIRIPFMLLVL